MPRKIKTAFTASDADRAITGIHDIGFIPRVRDGVKGFEMRVGGGTSIMPRVAPTLSEFVAADDGEYLRVTEAALRIFDRQDWLRVNRARARIKVLVDKIGIEAFREMVDRELEGDWVGERDFIDRPPAARARRGGQRARAAGRARLAERRPLRVRRLVAPTASQPQRQEGFSTVLVKVTRGDLTPEQFRGLGQMMRDFSGGNARTTVDQNFVLRWVRDEALYDVYAALRELGLAERRREHDHRRGLLPRHRLAASSGSPRSMGLNRALQERIEEMDITDPLTRQIHLKMSGCPNGCGQHHIGNIGFYGASIKVGGHTMPAYIAHIGGEFEKRRGRSTAAGSRCGCPPSACPTRSSAGCACTRPSGDDGEEFNDFADARRHGPLRGRGPRPRPAGRVQPREHARVHRLEPPRPLQGRARRRGVRDLDEAVGILRFASGSAGSRQPWQGRIGSD